MGYLLYSAVNSTARKIGMCLYLVIDFEILVCKVFVGSWILYFKCLGLFFKSFFFAGPSVTIPKRKMFSTRFLPMVG